MADNINFDFETEIESSHLLTQGQQQIEPPDLPAEAIGQQPANYRKNFRKTVCTYWLRGLCMKGDACGFLHQFVSDRMPVCRNLLKYGECHDQDCPYKHSLDEIKECNMYKLGFCIYGPACRYKHIKNPGPPPDPEEVEAAKPREYRNINVVVNQVNPGVAREDERPLKRPRPPPPGRERERDRIGDRDRDRDWDRPLALPAPPPPPPSQAAAGGGNMAQGPMGVATAAPGGGGPGGGAGGGSSGWFEGGRPGMDGGRGGGRGIGDRGGGRGGGRGRGVGWRGGGDDLDGGGGGGMHPGGRDQTAVGMPPVTAPTPGALPPMAGLIAPVMPGIMPGGGPGQGMAGPGGGSSGGGPPPGPGGGGGPMGHFDAGLFAAMAGQGFFPRPY